MTLASGGGHTQRVALCLQDNAPQRSPEVRGVPGQTDLGVCRGHASPVGDVLMVPGLRLINPAPRAARTPPPAEQVPQAEQVPTSSSPSSLFFQVQDPCLTMFFCFSRDLKAADDPQAHRCLNVGGGMEDTVWPALPGLVPSVSVNPDGESSRQPGEGGAVTHTSRARKRRLREMQRIPRSY